MVMEKECALHKENIDCTDDKVQRKRTRKAMSKVTLLLLAFGVLSYFSAFLEVPFGELFQRLIAFILEKSGQNSAYSYFVAKIIVNSSAFLSYITLFVFFVCIALPAYIFSKCVKLSDEDSFNLHGKAAKKWMCLFGFCQIVTMFASALSQGCCDFLFPDGIASASSGTVPVFSPEIDVFGFLLETLCVAVFVPFTEEYVFRGVIFGYLKRYGIIFAVVASAAVFGAAHSTPVQSVYAFSFGIVAAVATVVTGNLRTSILFHAMNNFLNVIYKYSPSFFGEMGYDIVFALIQTVIVVLGVVGLYLFVKKDGMSDSFSTIIKEEQNGESYVAGIREILTVPFVLYLVIYGVMFALTVMTA